MSSPRSLAAEPRRPQPRVRIDLRLLAGLLLVVVSVAGVCLLLAGADRTEPAYVSTSGIPAGASVTSSDLTLVRVRVDAIERYLTPETSIEGRVATRFLPAGELIPVSALGAERLRGMSSVVLQPELPLSASVSAGSRVDLWSSATDAKGGPPRVLAHDVEVAGVSEERGFLSASAGGRVEVVLPDASVPVVLAALAAKESIAIVVRPASG